MERNKTICRLKSSQKIETVSERPSYWRLKAAEVIKTKMSDCHQSLIFSLSSILCQLKHSLHEALFLLVSAKFFFCREVNDFTSLNSRNFFNHREHRLCDLISIRRNLCWIYAIDKIIVFIEICILRPKSFYIIDYFCFQFLDGSIINICLVTFPIITSASREKKQAGCYKQIKKFF